MASMIDTVFVIANSINIELVNKATTDPTEIQKLIDYIDKKIFITIDRELFENNSIYTYPEDLQLAEMYFLENLFEYRKIESLQKFNKKISIDDVSHEFRDINMYNWLPSSDDINEILQSYENQNNWYIDISFTNY